MGLGSPANGENQNISLWKWAEKEVSATDPGAAVTTFDFSTVATVTIKSLTELADDEVFAATFEETSSGLFEYYHVDEGEWVKTKGRMQLADCKVYFRKNGIDTLVDGSDITSIEEGSENIEVTFSTAVDTSEADSVLLSYAYQDVTNPEPSKFCVKDFDVKHNGRDYSVQQCLGGITFKRRQPLDLSEISLTTLKTGNSLSGIMLGERTNVTVNSIATRNVTGGNDVHNWAMSLVVTDPDNSNNKLCMIAVNIGANGVNPKGGADADFEETINFKTNPQDYCEIEYATT
jgi:hypothetical protein